MENVSEENLPVCNFCLFDSFLDDLIEIGLDFEFYTENDVIEQELFPAMDDILSAVALLKRARRKVLQARGNYVIKTPEGYDYLTPAEQLEISDSLGLN